MKTQSPHRLLDYLPSIYQGSPMAVAFLSAFDATIFGETQGQESEYAGADSSAWSIEGLIDGIPELFDPEETRDEFLPWLAQWAAISEFESIQESRRRGLIHKMIPLYAIRGTKAYVEQMIWICTGVRAFVEEGELPQLRIGTTSRVGEDTRLGQDTFHFRVVLDLASVPGAEARLADMLALQNLLVTLAKPAHTHFRLEHNIAGTAKGLMISVRSTVGVDTLLWHD